MTRPAVPPSTLLSLATLVLANLLPLAGVLLFGWSAFEVLILFWAENVVIGGYNLLRMLAVLLLRRDWAILAVAPFFAVHYGLFCAGHSVFLVGAFAPPDLRDQATSALPALFLSGALAVPLLALIASHGVSFLANFLWAGEWRHVDAKTLMGAPYPRIMILHVTIIVGMILVQALGAPVAAVALLVVIKIAVDTFAHLREHRRLAAPPAAQAAPAPAGSPS